MASSSETIMNRIEALNGSNYESWAFNVKLLLMERGLWAIVTGDDEIPKSTETEKKDKEIKEFKLRSDKAYSIIALSIEKALQIHITNTINPKVAWDALKKHFEFVSVTQIVRLTRAFYAATMEEDGDLMNHITHMTTLAERLRNLKEPIDDKKFGTVILGSLPESYENFLTSLNARDYEKLSWDEIKPLLLEEYMKKREKTGKTLKSADDALFTHASFSRGNSSGHLDFSQRRGRSNSFRAGGGFRSSNRGSRSFPGRRGGRNNFSKKCFSCNEVGHGFRECPNEEFSGREESNLCQTQSIGSLEKRRKINVEDDDAGTSFFEQDIALMVSEGKGRTSSADWFIDSAATSHMTFNKENLFDFIEYKQPTPVYLGNDFVISAVGYGKVRLPTVDENGVHKNIALQSVLYVPQLAKNLLSVKAMTNMGAVITFDKDKCMVTKGDVKFVLGQDYGSKLYRVNIVDNDKKVLKESAYIAHNCNLWHYRFGHMNSKYIEQLINKNLVHGMKKCEDNVCSSTTLGVDNCEPCTLAKMTRKSCPKVTNNRSSNILEIIHSDVCGPMQVNSHGGSRYILSFIDDATRYATIYLIKKKHEVLDKFKEYVNLVENHTGRQVSKLNILNNGRVKNIRSDGGGEYSSNEFIKYCADKGIVHQFSNPHTPEQNGVAERLNRTLVESVRSMIFHANLTPEFWAEAASTAVYLHNRSPTTSLSNTTPYECWFGKKPDVSNLKVFGCIAYYHVPQAERRKLDPKACKSIFVGYPEGTKGFKLFNIDTNKFIRSRNVIFHETTFHNFNYERKSNYVIFPLDTLEDTLVDGKELIVTATSTTTELDNSVENVNIENSNSNVTESSTLDTSERNNIEKVVLPSYEETFLHEVNQLGENIQEDLTQSILMKQMLLKRWIL